MADTETVRVGGSSWVHRLISRYREPGFMVGMPAEPVPPAPKPKRRKPDPLCGDCVMPDGQLLGRACKRHDYELMASLGFTQEDRLAATFYDAFGGGR